MERLSFIQEASNKHKLKILLTFFIILLILISIIVAIFATFKELILNPYVNSFRSAVKYEIENFSPTGLFYIGLFGGLFFVPLPQELFFYYGIVKQNPIIWSLIMVNAGYLIAQFINYYFGKLLSGFFIHLVSKKRVYKMRRVINKYGTRGIVIFNLLPLPSPLLTFALGLAKYNLWRLIFYTALGSFMKCGVIILFFFVTN